ncbi:MAG TPA: hypothetical protein VIK12_07115 [Pengzhenrongella sp.]
MVARAPTHGRHRALGLKPNSAYVLTPDGTITARIHWTNDDRAVAAALEDVLAGRRVVRRNRTVVPLVRAVGHLPAEVDRAGRKASHDVWRAAPPLAVLAGISRALTPLPVDRRGPWAAALLGVAVGAVALVVSLALG